MYRIVKMISIVLMMVMVICCSACGKGENNQTSGGTHASSAELVGKWKGTGNEISTITLGADGSYKDVADGVSIKGTYIVDSTEGTLTVNESEYGLVITYSYELSGDNLTLQMNGGLPRTFARK